MLRPSLAICEGIHATNRWRGSDVGGEKPNRERRRPPAKRKFRFCSVEMENSEVGHG